MSYQGVAPTGYALISTNDGNLHIFRPLLGDVVGGITTNAVSGIASKPIEDGVPQNNQILKYNSGQGKWLFATDEVGGGGSHTILSATHTDTSTAVALARGSILIGSGSSPVWAAMPLGLNGHVLYSNGIDILYTLLGQETPFSLGTQAAPSMTFIGDLDTGFSAAVANTIVVSVAGGTVATFSGPASALIVASGYVVNSRIVSATDTIDPWDYILVTSGNNFTLTLPQSSPENGRKFIVKDGFGLVSQANPINIAGGNKNIDGNATIFMMTPYSSFTLMYNGWQWNVL